MRNHWTSLLAVLGGLFAGIDVLGQEELPQPVDAYVRGIEARLRAEPSIQEGSGEVYDFDYDHLFTKTSVDYRSGSNDAWLIGYQVGVLRGKSKDVIARIVLVDARGNELFRYPDPSRGEVVDDGCYTDAVTATMAPDIYMIAMSAPAGRKTPGFASMWTLGQNPHETFVCRDVTFPKEPGIESTLYFYDINDDGRKELLSEESIFKYSRRQKETKQRVFRLGSNGAPFVEVTADIQNQLDAIFLTVKHTPEVPKIKQEGRPYDPTLFNTRLPSSSGLNLDPMIMIGSIVTCVR